MALVRKHPQQMRKLFVYSDEILDADQLLSLIEAPLTTPVTHQTWVWCKEYIVERSTEKTVTILFPFVGLYPCISSQETICA